MIQTTHNGLSGGESTSSGSCLQINDLILNENILVLGKFEGRNPQLIDYRIMQRETSDVMRHHAPETAGDC